MAEDKQSQSPSLETISSRKFASRYSQRPERFAWLLGAGASASAGIPTGYAMIADFKKQLFCEESGVPPRGVDSNDPLWQERIETLLSKRAEYPGENTPTEYAWAFEAAFPTQQARRDYIERAIRKGTPSYGHRVLASLITSKKAQCLFTTNFDPLIDSAATITDQKVEAQERALLTVAGIDNAERAAACMREKRWPLLAKLHGDYQSAELKNTNDELKEQDAQMRRLLVDACGQFGLVVVGYSGRDDSIMSALSEVLEKPGAFPGGLFWVTQTGTTPLPAVETFLENAQKAGVSVSLVESHTFDELAADIFNYVDLPPVLTEHVSVARPKPILQEVALPETEARKFPVLQCSALKILSMPTVARIIKLDEALPTTRARELLREADVYAVVASRGRELAAFGDDKALLKAFSSVGASLAGTCELNPSADSWAKGLLYDALIRALCRYRPLSKRLRTRGHSVLVRRGHPDEPPEYARRRNQQLRDLQSAYEDALTGEVKGLGYAFSEGVDIRLDSVCGGWWCVFEPSTSVHVPRLPDDQQGSEQEQKRLDDRATLADWRREKWAQRYNAKWTKIIAAWARLLTSQPNEALSAIGIGEQAGIDAEFELSANVAWSRPSHEHGYFLRGGR